MIDVETRTASRRFFPDSVIEEILRQVAAGESLTAVLENNPGFPGRTSWHRWIVEDPLLSARYVRAVQEQIAARYATK